MRKYNVLQLGLQQGFRIAMTTYNSTYFYIMSVIEKVTKVAMDTTHRLCMQLMQLCCNKRITIIMSLHYNHYAIT
jgi:hypothetical protein